MVRHINADGLSLMLIRLDGTLVLNFANTPSFNACYTFHDTEVQDTTDMFHARARSYGQPIITIGLEMILEKTNGVLAVDFRGSFGSTLTFQFDGRQALPGQPTIFQQVDQRSLKNTPKPDIQSTSELLGLSPSTDLKVIRPTPVTMYNAKVQTSNAKTRNVRTQTRFKKFTRAAGTQTICSVCQPRKIKRDVILTNTGQKDMLKAYQPTAPFVKESNGAGSLYTSAVNTLFCTFHTPLVLHDIKNTPITAANPSHNLLTNIFLEGYRNGSHTSDLQHDEGRLHIDLATHQLIWESHDEYDGGTRIALDRLELAATYTVSCQPLERAHHFGDYQFQLKRNESEVRFCMDFHVSGSKMFGNVAGKENERISLGGKDRIGVLLGAVRECLGYRGGLSDRDGKWKW